MQIQFEKKSEPNRNVRTLIYSVIAALMIMAHLTFLDLIQISEILPDLLLILCVWVSLREGRFYGMFFGFIVGLFFDIAGLDVVGTNALAKLSVCFLAGSFSNPGKEKLILQSFRFLLIVALSSIIHNLIYYTLYIKLTDLHIFIFKYVLANSLYTTLIAIIPLVYYLPKRNVFK